MTNRAVTSRAGMTGAERVTALAAFLTLCAAVAWVVIDYAASGVALWRLGPWTSAQVQIALAAAASTTFACAAFAGIYAAMRRGMSLGATMVSQLVWLAVFIGWLVAVGACIVAWSWQPAYVCIPESDDECRYVVSARQVWAHADAQAIELLTGKGSRYAAVQVRLPQVGRGELDPQSFKIRSQGSSRVLTYLAADGTQARVELPTPR
jgi:hypothetical protein